MEPSWDGCRTRLSGWLAWLLGESCSCFTPGKGTGKHQPRISVVQDTGPQPSAAQGFHLCQPQAGTSSAPSLSPALWDSLRRGCGWAERAIAGQQSQVLVLALAKALPGAACTRSGTGVETPVLVYNRTHTDWEIGPGSPCPTLSPAPTPSAAKKCFQTCRLNTFFVHFRLFTLYPTSLGSSNIFPSFDRSISQRVFIGWDAFLTKLLLSYITQI